MKQVLIALALAALPGMAAAAPPQASAGDAAANVPSPNAKSRRSIYDKNFDVPSAVHSGRTTVAQVPECTAQATPEYPHEALGSGAHGMVRARIEVGVDGRVKNVDVEHSSLVGGNRAAFEAAIRKAAAEYRCDQRGQPYQVVQEFVFRAD